MLTRLGAKTVFLVFGLALVFGGGLMVPFAIVAALAPAVGAIWAYVITAAVLLVPALTWAAIVLASAPPDRPSPSAGLLGGLVGLLARETPWVALLTGALTGAAQAYFSRGKGKR